jgi:hypothetical protein
MHNFSEKSVIENDHRHFQLTRKVGTNRVKCSRKRFKLKSIKECLILPRVNELIINNIFVCGTYALRQCTHKPMEIDYH